MNLATSFINRVKTWIHLKDCVVGNVYRMVSRHLSYAVYQGDGRFTGIREKYKERFLDDERHWDNMGTAKPVKDLGSIPEYISTGDWKGLFDCQKSIETIDTVFQKTISDGFGNSWSRTCPMCKGDTMEIVRPGKVQCTTCG